MNVDSAKSSTVIVKRFLALGALWVLGLVHTSLSIAVESSAEPPRKILFVGNSFTYYNRSIHYYVGGLLIAAEEYLPGKTNLRSMTISGGRLREHEPGLSAMVQREQWDTVILQGYSTGPIDPDTAPGFREAAKRLSETVRANGAEPAFLMTWPYRGRLDMTGPLAATYTEIGFELDAPVLPVGIAFARSINDYPEIELYVPDVEGFNETGDEIGRAHV